MNVSSNQVTYNPKTSRLVAVNLANSLAINTKTLIFTGNANSSVCTDLLFRNFNTSTAVLFDIWIGANNTSAENNRVQVSIPANSGNNGVVSIASLAALCPQLFDNNLAGDRVIFLEDASISIWVENKAALSGSGQINVTAKVRDF